MLLLLLLAPLAASLVAGDQYSSRYSGHRVLRTSPANCSTRNLLHTGLAALEGLDLWRPATDLWGADIMLAPGVHQQVSRLLDSLGLEAEVWIEDVEKLVRRSSPAVAYVPDTKSGIVVDYISHEEINAHMDRVAETHEDTETFSIGSSYEGRDMRVLAITRAGGH